MLVVWVLEGNLVQQAFSHDEARVTPLWINGAADLELSKYVTGLCRCCLADCLLMNVRVDVHREEPLAKQMGGLLLRLAVAGVVPGAQLVLCKGGICQVSCAAEPSGPRGPCVESPSWSGIAARPLGGRHARRMQLHRSSTDDC